MCEDEKKLTFFKEFFNTLYIFMLVIQLINLTSFLLTLLRAVI